MLPVADRPLVAHVAAAAVAAGVDELVVVDHDDAALRAAIGEEFRDVPVTYATQTDRDGTAGAVRAASPHLEGPFAVLNADNLYDPSSLRALFDAGPAVGVYRVEDPTTYGVLTTVGDTVTGVVEKPDDPPTSLANTGAYALPAAASDRLDVRVSERGERELTDVLESVIDTHEVTAVEFDRWLDVGRPWELLEANERALGDIERDIRGDVHPDATVDGAVVVEEGATVHTGAVIDGPVLVRTGASVGPNAHVRGRTVLGPGTRVGHSVEVKNSVLMSGASVPHLSYVGDSVLGRNVNLGAGTTIANLRHDDDPVRLTVKGERVSTGRRKFGVVLGDGVRTGIDTTLNAGVTLSTDATTEPGETVTRDR
jgi:bifunctional UDP-N-acetylglucosamine pyrophosphorylase/glucosamine-1-phosphate N-acetyltransferase